MKIKKGMLIEVVSILLGAEIEIHYLHIIKINKTTDCDQKSTTIILFDPTDYKFHYIKCHDSILKFSEPYYIGDYCIVSDQYFKISDRYNILVKLKKVINHAN